MHYRINLLPLCLFFVFLLGCDGRNLNTPLKADAGSDLHLEAGSEVVLYGDSSGHGNDKLSFHWHQPEGQTLALSNSRDRGVRVTVPSEDSKPSYTLFLTVTDDQGNTSTDTITIRVKQPEMAPMMVADFEGKRLLMPVALGETHQLSIDLARSRVVNGDLRLVALNGSSDAVVGLSNAVTGDEFPVVLTAPGLDGEVVEENWQLVLTALPIIHLGSDHEIENEPKKPATLVLLEPYSNGEIKVFRSPMGVEYRGNTSLAYAKKSFDIELWKSESNSHQHHHHAEERKVELLGMRDDGDWVLDAMYIDYARMRNRVSTDLWLDFAHLPDWSDAPKYAGGTSGQHVEVVFNDRYHGVYMLTEQIDRKQLDLKDTKKGKTRGVLYKADLWGSLEGGLVSKFEVDVELPRADQLQWHGWQLKYPKEPSAEAWAPLSALYDFVRSASDEEFKAGITQFVDLNNIIDYALLINVIYGKDNQGKNTYFAVFDQTSAKDLDDRIYYVPWDMDGTWGRWWSSQKDGYTGWLDNTLLSRIYATNPNNYRGELKSRWQGLREMYFSQADLMARFEQYTQLLNDSGAIARENERWGDQLFNDKGADLNLELENLYLSQWSTNRLNWLDNYIEQNY